MLHATLLATPTSSLNGSLPRWADLRRTLAPDGWCLSLMTSRSARSSTNYRIVYRLREEAVEIATVFHGARLFDSIEVMTSERRTSACSRRRAGRASADTPRYAAGTGERAEMIRDSSRRE